MPVALIYTIYPNKINSKLVIYVTKIKNTGSSIIIFFTMDRQVVTRAIIINNIMREQIII